MDNSVRHVAVSRVTPAKTTHWSIQCGVFLVKQCASFCISMLWYHLPAHFRVPWKVFSPPHQCFCVEAKKDNNLLICDVWIFSVYYNKTPKAVGLNYKNYWEYPKTGIFKKCLLYHNFKVYRWFKHRVSATNCVSSQSW